MNELLELICQSFLFKYLQNLELCLKEEKDKNEKLKTENEELKNRVNLLQAEVKKFMIFNEI